MSKFRADIKVLENQLDQALTKYNDLQSKNRGLRKEIDVMRKQQGVQNRVNNGYIAEIKKASETIKNLNVKTQTGARGYEETNNQILALKAKHEIDKFTFETKILELQDQLREKDESENDISRTKDLATKNNKLASGGENFSNPAALLRRRLDKWTANNKEKKQLMDTYKRNVQIIEDAFEQIKEATGISSTEEIVTTFIKAEEQNISLWNYVYVLNSEIDMIEEQNKQIEAQIKQQEEIQTLTSSDKEKMRESLQKQSDEIKAQIKQRESQIQFIESQMGDITKFVQNMVTQFNKSHFQNLQSVSSH